MPERLEGVCCTCQSRHPVRHATKGHNGLLDGFDDVDDYEGESGGYLMASHDAFGSFCEGSGTMPQAIVHPKKTAA